MAFSNGSFQQQGWNERVVTTPASAQKAQCDEEDRHCRTCRSPSLIIDWAQGDRVCTNCGVVDEEHLRDSRPEWKDFSDADDLAKGLPSAARSGLVPVDETKYIGGLQPTTLSKTVFGGGSAFSTRRKRLLATTRKVDFMMQKQHAAALKDAKLSRTARQSKLHRGEECDDSENSARPDYESLLLQEEEDAQRSRDALYAEKWSIERAILLHGNGQDTSTTTHGPLAYHTEREEREDLVKRLDAPLLKASEDLYGAYIMLQEASRKLHLPDRVLHESVAMLCNYATRRDGIIVKGVSSRMTKSADTISAVEKKEAMERLRAYNKLKQNGSLGAALLFLTARKLGWTRSLSEVCNSFQPQEGIVKGKEAFIKSKHCSRAINEVRALFPHYGQLTGRTAKHGGSPSSVSDADSIASFVEHATRKLELPPVALASIRTLVQHYRKEQLETETEKSVAKLSTICASMSLFVCLAGASLQRLAQQAQNSDFLNSKRMHVSAAVDAVNEKPNKRIKVEVKTETKDSSEQSTLLNRLFDEEIATVSPDRKDTAVPDIGATAFDVFSHSAVEYQASEKKKYEMRRTWDAWSEQMPWLRSISRIEQSCGVSRNSVLQFYKNKIYPRRQALLEVLQQDAASCASTDAPMASILLKNIAAAAPLLNSRGQL